MPTGFSVHSAEPLFGDVAVGAGQRAVEGKAPVEEKAPSEFDAGRACGLSGGHRRQPERWLCCQRLQTGGFPAECADAAGVRDVIGGLVTAPLVTTPDPLELVGLCSRREKIEKKQRQQRTGAATDGHREQPRTGPDD